MLIVDMVGCVHHRVVDGADPGVDHVDDHLVVSVAAVGVDECLLDIATAHFRRLLPEHHAFVRVGLGQEQVRRLEPAGERRNAERVDGGRQELSR